MANAVLSGRVNADFTPPPPSRRREHPEASVWRKKAQEIQRLRSALNSAGTVSIEPFSRGFCLSCNGFGTRLPQFAGCPAAASPVARPYGRGVWEESGLPERLI